MAMSPRRPLRRGCLEFLTADIPTPALARYIIRFDELKKIAIYFLETGQASKAVSWEGFDPQAIQEAMSDDV